MDIPIEVNKVYKLASDGNTKAFADIVVANSILIKGLRVINGKNGLFVGMPRKQGKDGQWYPSVFPLTGEIKQHLNSKVLEAYQEA